jgi:hypothetical protein
MRQSEHDGRGAEFAAAFHVPSHKSLLPAVPSLRTERALDTTQLFDITSSGEIVGFCNDSNGVFHGFTLIAGIAAPWTSPVRS